MCLGGSQEGIAQGEQGGYQRGLAWEGYPGGTEGLAWGGTGRSQGGGKRLNFGEVWR